MPDAGDSTGGSGYIGPREAAAAEDTDGTLADEAPPATETRIPFRATPEMMGLGPSSDLPAWGGDWSPGAHAELMTDEQRARVAADRRDQPQQRPSRQVRVDSTGDPELDAMAMIRAVLDPPHPAQPELSLEQRYRVVAWLYDRYGPPT